VGTLRGRPLVWDAVEAQEENVETLRAARENLVAHCEASKDAGVVVTRNLT